MVMEVKKIIVDKLPISCSECLLCEQHGKPGSFEGWCWALKTEVIPFHIPRPTACPLQMEKECIWVGEYGGWDEHGDTIFFSKKTSCSDVHIQKIKVPDNTYCSNCGRRIRYQEEK